jgi:hypothetical protein
MRKISMFAAALITTLPEADFIWAVRLNQTQMRKISMLAAALILIAVGAWAVATTPHVVASTPARIDPHQMMTNARDLPAAHYVDYTLIFP